MENDQAVFFRDQLRSARSAALADAEGFHELIHAFELLGQKLLGTAATLRQYKPKIIELAKNSPLATNLPTRWPDCHTGFDALFEELRQARNDAMHQGAHARTLTQHAIELSLILEDALMLNASKVAQFMVRDVTEAKAWHPISYIRQLMLTHAFSYLPLRDEETWKVVPDYSIARYLRKGEPKLRNARLTNVTSEAVGSGDLKLLKAQVASPTTLIADIVADISEQPLLVVDQAHKDEIVGILTASDIL